MCLRELREGLDNLHDDCERACDDEDRRKKTLMPFVDVLREDEGERNGRICVEMIAHGAPLDFFAELWRVALFVTDCILWRSVGAAEPRFRAVGSKYDYFFK